LKEVYKGSTKETTRAIISSLTGKSNDPTNGSDAWTGGLSTKKIINFYVKWARYHNIENTDVFFVVGKTRVGYVAYQTFYQQEPSETNVPHKASGNLYKTTFDKNNTKTEHINITNIKIYE